MIHYEHSILYLQTKKVQNVYPYQILKNRKPCKLHPQNNDSEKLYSNYQTHPRQCLTILLHSDGLLPDNCLQTTYPSNFPWETLLRKNYCCYCYAYWHLFQHSMSISSHCHSTFYYKSPQGVPANSFPLNWKCCTYPLMSDQFLSQKNYAPGKQIDRTEHRIKYN